MSLSLRRCARALCVLLLAIPSCSAPAPGGGGADAGPEAPADGAKPVRDGAPAHTDGAARDAAVAPSGDIAMVLYPNFTAQDLIGPHTVFSVLGGHRVHLVWKTLDPVTSDTGVTVHPTTTFEDTPLDLEMLFVPGTLLGFPSLKDEELISFIRSRGSRARYVTSVCTGSLFLGVAGLLKGYRATSHWATRDMLAALGADPVAARYVEDRNRITGAGVTAGLDFGLIVASRLEDQPAAERVQLLLEYDPAPPFDAGSPETAPAAVRDGLNAFLAPFLQDARATVEAAGAKLP